MFCLFCFVLLCYVCMYVCTCICIHFWIYIIYIYICAYRHIYICVCVCDVRVCVCDACACACVCVFAWQAQRPWALGYGLLEVGCQKSCELFGTPHSRGSEGGWRAVFKPVLPCRGCSWHGQILDDMIQNRQNGWLLLLPLFKFLVCWTTMLNHNVEPHVATVPSVFRCPGGGECTWCLPKTRDEVRDDLPGANFQQQLHFAQFDARLNRDSETPFLVFQLAAALAFSAKWKSDAWVTVFSVLEPVGTVLGNRFIRKRSIGVPRSKDHDAVWQVLFYLVATLA